MNTFENIMENGAFTCSIFHNIFKYMIYLMPVKAQFLQYNPTLDKML